MFNKYCQLTKPLEGLCWLTDYVLYHIVTSDPWVTAPLPRGAAENLSLAKSGFDTSLANIAVFLSRSASAPPLHTLKEYSVGWWLCGDFYALNAAIRFGMYKAGLSSTNELLTRRWKLSGWTLKWKLDSTESRGQIVQGKSNRASVKHRTVVQWGVMGVCLTITAFPDVCQRRNRRLRYPCLMFADCTKYLGAAIYEAIQKDKVY